MNHFHGIFFLIFPFSKTKFLFFMQNIQKQFREIDFYNFTRFFGLDFLKFWPNQCKEKTRD